MAYYILPTKVGYVYTGVLAQNSGGHAYVVGTHLLVAGGLGLCILDIAEDPAAPKKLRTVDTGVFSHDGGGSVAFGMERYAFCAGGLGLAVVELFGESAPDTQGGGDGDIVVVQLTKPTSSAPVGVDLVGGGDASSPVVLKEAKGLALACGVLQPGDLLLSVNEVEVTDPEAAVALIRAAPDRLVLRFRRPPVSRSDADHPRSARRRVQFFDEGGYEGGYEGGSFGGGDGGDGGGGDGGGGDGGGGDGGGGE